MTTENIKLDEIPKLRREVNLVRAKVIEFLNSDEDVLVFRCKDKAERDSVYNNIYAFSKRRHDMPIHRYRRGNDVYITKTRLEYE